jgi:chromosomal replication initiation ATPase DnaA
LPFRLKEFIPITRKDHAVSTAQAERAHHWNKTSTYAVQAMSARRAPRGGTRREEVIEICEAMHDVLAACFSVSGRELRAQGRARAEICRVRQIGMYVAHVIAGLSMFEVGCGFQRDRSTVAHACHLVEDLRDDPDFERVILMIERIAEAAFARSGGR